MILEMGKFPHNSLNSRLGKFTQILIVLEWVNLPVILQTQDWVNLTKSLSFWK